MRYLIISAVTLLVAGSAIAQIDLGNRNNKASQPLWGPTGYDYVEYYYLPQIETYFDVPQQKFYHNENGRWVLTAELPPPYDSKDIFRLYKFVVNDFQPYKNHSKYKDEFASFKGYHAQQLIRDSNDTRYFFKKGYSGNDIPVQRSGFANNGRKSKVGNKTK